MIDFVGKVFARSCESMPELPDASVQCCVTLIEEVRKAASPSRRHFGSARAARMPADAIVLMENLHRELRSLKSNKRPGSPGWVA